MKKRNSLEGNRIQCAIRDILSGQKLKRNHGMLKNLKHTSYDKKILILYMIDPFTHKIEQPLHVNVEQSVIIANIFSALGYNIDIADCANEYEFDLEGYDIVFGFGRNFDRAARESNAYTIAYLTGASPYWSNQAELYRLKAFQKRTGATIKLRRQVGSWDLYAGVKTDAAICTGNKWTESTWKGIYEKIFTINNQGLGRNACNRVQRNLIKAKRGFCFFSGSGNLHKGLDLILECFRELQEFDLYIATPMDSDFSQVYSDMLARENVHVLGKINVESEEYLNMCQSCLFSILVSCSEGQASSVATTMYSGMIPIITKECGIDIIENENGFYVHSIEIEQLTRQIKEIADLPNEMLAEISENVKTRAKIFHSLENFENQFGNAVKQILNDKNN